MHARIDGTRADDARKICEFVLSHVQEGRYVPAEALWPESSAYRAELAATLSIAGRLLGQQRYVNAASGMFDRLLLPDERVDGLCPIGYWCAFPVYHGLPLDWRERDAQPEPRSTALVLYCLAIHHHVSGEDRFVAPALEAMAQMFGRWDFEPDKESMLHLSAEAAALAVKGWEHALPQYARKKEPLIDWALRTYVESAPRDFPFLTAMRAMLLLAATGTLHLHTVIRPAFDGLLAERSWRFTPNGHDFRHLSGWMDRMRSPEGGAYGCKDIPTGRRYCLGSCPQYIQLWWILGGFFL